MKILQHYIQDTLAFISQKGYETNHAKFLKSTAVFLAELFKVNYVLIDKYSIKTPNITETIVLYGKRCFIQNLSYNLENTPCDTIINKKFCSYRANVKNIFPKDDFLRQNNIESYFGKPLWNSKKEPIGLIAIMDAKQKSLSEENNIAIVLDIIAIKIEEVLEKMFFENQLNLKIGELIIAKEKAEKSEHQLNVAQKIANLGYWEHDILNNKLIWSDEIYRILNLKPQELEAREDLFVKNVHPDDKDKVEEEYLNAFKNKKAYEVEYRLMLPSGEIKYILGKGHKKYNDKGNPIYSFGTVINITKQKKVEQKLVKLKEEAEKSEEKFKKLANLIFEGIVISENGAVIECNSIFLKMFGYSIKEILGKKTINVLFPEKYHKKITKNRLKKHVLPYEIEGIRKDGTTFPVEIEARNIDLGNDKFNRLISFRDLTLRKKTQIENRKLSTAIEQSANTVIITDIYGNIEYTNPKFTETTGYSTQEVLGKNPRILNSGAQPKQFYANLWQTIVAGNIWSGQLKNKTKSGKFYWEQVTITPVKDETGKILSYLAIKEDITAKKNAEENLIKATEEITKSEKKFRDLFEKSGDAILIIKNGIFTDCNQATLDLLGYKKFEDVINSHPSKLSPEFQPDGSKSFEKAEELIKITLKKGAHRFEWWHTKRIGDIFPVEVLLTTIENEPNNQVIHCVWRDITKRKQAEHDLLIAKEKAEESDRLKTEFIQNMSHEIRTPMNGILGFSELLDNPILSVEKRKHFIEIIKNSSNQLLHIIDDILEISELETKQVKVVENTVCLNDFLYELFTVFNIKATKNNTSLTLKKGLSDQESMILTDKNKLNKVLSNLLENALKFTIRGTIELGYLRKGNELEIFVKDSGIGIDPENQELIFERFSQAEKDLSKNVGGLGLGLSIAKENAELLGGKISVISKLGEGAAFFVNIPYKPINLILKIKKEKEKPTLNKEKYTILIAEDEEVNFMFLEILLVDKIKLSCNIIHAKDGLEAVAHCKNNPAIELVLMDIKMPNMNGREATKLIKEFRPNLPIIAQTAYSTTEERENAILAGCNDFITKPISKDALSAVINNYLVKP